MKPGDDHDRVLGYRAKILLGMYQGKQAAGDYEWLLESAKQSRDRKQEFESLLGLASAYYVIALNEPDFAPKSLELHKQAYTLARELGDKAYMAQALISTTRLSSFWMDYRGEAAANAEAAIMEA